ALLTFPFPRLSGRCPPARRGRPSGLSSPRALPVSPPRPSLCSRTPSSRGGISNPSPRCSSWRGARRLRDRTPPAGRLSPKTPSPCVVCRADQNRIAFSLSPWGRISLLLFLLFFLLLGLHGDGFQLPFFILRRAALLLSFPRLLLCLLLLAPRWFLPGRSFSDALA